MLSQIRSSAIVGIDAVAVDVEVLSIPVEKESFQIVGLVDSAVREARGRIASALHRNGCTVPKGIFVNLAPAEVKKEGSAFDLPMAVGIYCTANKIKTPILHSTFFFGELSLDGSVRSVRGVVALAICAVENGAAQIVVPAKNVAEASLVKGLTVIGVNTLREALAVLHGESPQAVSEQVMLQPVSKRRDSLSQVKGQHLAKRAMAIAAAGGHNLIFIGPPGCGKSMLAQRFTTLLPALTEEERFETVKIHSIVGLPLQDLLGGKPPFRSPHHVVSDVGLIGGGATPRPGEISLAHRGVLFLDEFPEYRRSALEALRTPLETGEVRISRAKGSSLLPAQFQLIAAMNPCPCGRLGSKNQRCICSESMLQIYMRRLSQPILERIDLHVELEEVTFTELTEAAKDSTSIEDDRSQIVERIRVQQRSRQKQLNSRLESESLLSKKIVDSSSMRLLENAARKNLISARSFVKILRVARTLADFDDSGLIYERHVAEAMSFRVLDRRKAGAMHA